MSNKDNQTVWNKHRNFLCSLHSEGLSCFSDLFRQQTMVMDFWFRLLWTEWRMPIIAYRLLAEFTLWFLTWYNYFLHLLRKDMMSIFALPTGMCKLFRVISEYNWLHLLTTIYFCCIIPCLVLIVKTTPKMAPSHQFTLEPCFVLTRWQKFASFWVEPGPRWYEE